MREYLKHFIGLAFWGGLLVLSLVALGSITDEFIREVSFVVLGVTVVVIVVVSLIVARRPRCDVCGETKFLGGGGSVVFRTKDDVYAGEGWICNTCYKKLLEKKEEVKNNVGS